MPPFRRREGRGTTPAQPGETPWLIIASLREGLLAAFDDRVIIVKNGVVTAL